MTKKDHISFQKLKTKEYLFELIIFAKYMYETLYMNEATNLNLVNLLHIKNIIQEHPFC